MRKLFFIIYTASAIVASGCSLVMAQTVPVGELVLDDYYRRAQLLGKTDSDFSFTVRPLSKTALPNVKDVYDPDSSLAASNWVKTGPVTFGNGHGLFQILPLNWQQQFNSHHPYGWNDGSMIPAKGYQTRISGGFYIKYGPLSVQLRPEFVYAANNAFRGFDAGRSDADLRGYYIYHNLIDWPERYGVKDYSKAFWGQSSVRLSAGPVSLGLSTENVWWGPGIHNSLILSNNAPGFAHLAFNTIRPIKTPIGSFEGQILAGRLEASGYPPLLTTQQSDGTDLYTPKPEDWRYFTGFNINYHLKWVPGLTLGLTRTFNAYHNDVSGFAGYFPFFTSYQKVKSGINGDPFPRDQYTSVYARWLFQKAQAEVYFEYGLNDNAYDYRDFIGSPDHSRAYIFGLRKMVPISGSAGQHILLGAEITQLSQSPDRLVRDAGGWYIHGGVFDGHTNQGQILGAGTGSGGNLQAFEASWVSGIKKLGITIDRYEHNVDFYRYRFGDIGNNSGKWVDFAFGTQGEWGYKNLLFNAKLQYIKSLNYEWVLKDYNGSDYYIPHNSVSNVHAELGVTFRF